MGMHLEIKLLAWPVEAERGTVDVRSRRPIQQSTSE
jgi:hypothetical protein